MIRAALDSNVLIYAELEPETEKGKHAHHLIAACAPRGILAVQSLLEFIAVVRRRRPLSLESAIAKTRTWGAVFETAPTTRQIAERALTMVRDHQFQVWDAVIWTTVTEAGATVFFSEDLQDGFVKDGMRAVNPFLIDAANLQAMIDA